MQLVALGARALVGALALSGCGDYDPETPPGAGGTGTTVTGMLGSAGQSASAGTGGGAAGAGTGGTAPMAGGASGAGGSGASPVVPVEADCDAVEACGGDVVGTWAVAGSCLPISGMADMAGFGLGCTAAPVTGALEVSGTWRANADGSFTDETTTSGDSAIELPAECLNVSGTTTTCDRLGGALQALGYASVTCANAASGGGCSCSATAAQTGGLAMVVFGAASSGSYTVADNVVTTSTPAGSSTEYAYCVSDTGRAMVMTPKTIGKTGALTGTIAFAKQ
ncbi:MAG TPA: hypothetical protein VMG12_31660 [Polyangiaceae bacterium]|nr:hypothetical protein [Polyangiaceae bacterium]